MGPEHDEAEWIRQGRAGDPEAFGVLVERYQRMVHAVTYRMTSRTRPYWGLVTASCQ